MLPPELTVLGVLFLLSFFLALLLIPLFRHLYRLTGLLDCPDGRRKHQQVPIPLAGGSGILIATSAALIGADFSGTLSMGPRLISLLASLWLIGLVGWIDDARGLRARYKLLGQILAVSLLVGSGHLNISCVTLFGWSIDLGPFGLICTFVWMIGIINAVNLIDGMDGLLGTVGAIILITFAAIAGLAGQWYIAAAALALSGALLGFLVFNLPPASVYLGDCGSMVVGMMVGTLAIQGTIKGSAALTLTPLLALLIMPILDTSAAIIRRRLTGRSIYSPDRGHLHHSLLRRGFNRSGALLFIGILELLACGGAFAAVYYGHDIYALLSVIVVVTILITTRSFGHVEFSLIRERFLGLVAAFRYRHVPGSSHQMEVRLQGQIDWNTIWDTLIAEAMDLNLSSIRLDVNAPALHEGYHARWDRFEVSPESLNVWRADVPLFLEGQVIGQLSAAGLCDPDSICPTLARLADLVNNAEDSVTKIAACASRKSLSHEPADPVVIS